MKIKSILVGYGKWGKVLHKKSKIFFFIKEILQRNSKIKKKNLDSYEWALVSSPNETHYKYVNFFLKNKVNVFCEKPLTNNYSSAKKLIHLSKKLNVKLFISEIEIFKNKKIVIKKKNFIERKKFSSCSINEIPKRLAYHDFYLLYPNLKNTKLSIKELKKNKRSLSFQINAEKKIFYFFYDLQSKKKIHLINKVSLNSRKSYIGKMLKYMLSEKCDFTTNHKRALFALKLCNLLERKMKDKK